ncbi:MAG TPA: histidine kinase dimerization/phosphoacceptor domain -containing protein [Candidatus Methanoperedens sp.]|nr:histidine kinase dimerization/phosphoacceptor domain -containing protein [Candidatus Methanoperedens sp.]
MNKLLRVLIVEDSKFDARVLIGELENGGYRLDHELVDNPEDMRAALGKKPWDIVISDFVMPNFSGMDAIRILQESGLDIPIIIVSGKIGEDTAVESMKAGAHDYIIKGNLARLIPAIERELFEAEERRKRKRVEAELKSTKEKLESFINNTSDAIIIIDMEKKILQVNKGFEKLYGWTATEAIGIQLPIIPDNLMPETKKLLAEVESGKVITAHETIRRRKDKTLFDVSVTISPIKDASGKVVAFAGISRDITERKRAEEQTMCSLLEKETLLREIHHRVKNNMQVISSLLRLQSKYIKDKDDLEIFKDSQNRISSMSLVHEKLYQSNDFTKIDFSVYVNDLVKSLFHSYGAISNNIIPNIKVNNVSLGIDSAIPCGLIINELVTNSLKHAFPDGRKGEIRVFMGQTGEKEFELVIRDNGVGIAQGIDFDKSDTLGLHLVRILAENQLHGEINLIRNHGSEFKINFKGAK